MIGDLFAILGLALFCFLFWQQRRQSELAKAAIARRCERLDIQLLSVAFKKHSMGRFGGKLRWYTQYQFEFSALGDDYYQAELFMHGFRVGSFAIPPYRMGESDF